MILVQKAYYDTLIEFRGWLERTCASGPAFSPHELTPSPNSLLLGFSLRKKELATWLVSSCRSPAVVLWPCWPTLRAPFVLLLSSARAVSSVSSSCAQPCVLLLSCSPSSLL